METIRVVQEAVKLWADNNFGPETVINDPIGIAPLLGIVEEVGELCHVRLKSEQGIQDVNVADEKDAIGDILLFMLHYCSRRGFDMEEILLDTWSTVKKRDWKANPSTGYVGEAIPTDIHNERK